MNITSVDTPYLTVTSSDVRVTNNSPDNIGVVIADGSNENLNGQISWDNGTTWHDLDKGAYVDIPYLEINKVVFKLDGHVAGHVKLDYSVEVQEKDATNPRTVTDSVEFDVAPVADGLANANVTIEGDEDTFVELKANNASFSTLDSLDPTEELSSLVLQGVPNGYLIYIGSSGSEVLANNLGQDALGNNSWSIDVSGPIPQVWLRAPKDIGGVSSVTQTDWNLVDTIKLTTGVTDMGQQVFSTQDVLLTVNAVADGLVSIDAQNSSGKEGEDISMVFNAIVQDIDGSEKISVTLTGLGAYAIFKLSGVELDASSVVYDDGTDTYTITDSAIDYQTVKDLTFAQNDFSGEITVGIKTVELSNGDESATTTDTFNVTITQEDGSTSDDILLFDLKGNDGLAGEDTLVFGTDWNSTGIDFTTLADNLTLNVETLDLREQGDHHITLNTTDVEAMTDARNTLLVESDAGDTITVQNDADNVWAQQGSSSVYESTNGAILTINGAGTIDDSAVVANSSDNVLGYNDTNIIDGAAGDDRLIIFDGVEVDFSKVKNIETIDFEVTGDHTISNLTLNDVINATDGNNHLKIFGSDVNDSVDFDANDNWVKNTNGQVIEGGKTFDVFTSVNDASVEVKVEEVVMDSI